MKKVKILVCCHKETPRMKDEVFAPILLGSKFAKEPLKADFSEDFWDSNGENIGELHPYCAELTSIYWAWKNYARLGNPDYIGLFHYRRFFNFSEEINETDLWKCAFFDFDEDTRRRFAWHEKDILDFCEGYDLVLPHSEMILDPYDWQTPATLETHYKHSHYPEDFDVAISLIKRSNPAYKEAADAAITSQQGHFCNMFIMTREKFFDYAEWLFSIILPLKDLLPISDEKYEKAEQKRVLGFLAERLFNVWITKQRMLGVSIKETQRLTGYLSDADKKLYLSQHGKKEFEKAQHEAKRNVERFAAEKTVQDKNVTVHAARITRKPAVSVLIPVYNVGEFLEECLESLVHQTLENTEFIFVYDKSNDNSYEILMKYYASDPRITVIEQKESEGLGGARNRGMEFARGKYIAFIDADDICDLQMFEKLYRKAEALGADIVTCSVMGFCDRLENQYLHRQLEWYGDSDRLLPLSGRPQQLMEPAAWCKLFRADYIKNLDYFEFRTKTVAWEDVPAMTSAFIQTDRLATVQEALYFYRQRSSGNLSNSMHSRYINEFLSGAKAQRAILEKYHFSDEEVLSYIEEFKFLYAEWILSKMNKKDIPYFFHQVPQLFKKEDKKYLKRVFDLYPHRKRFYTVMMTRSAVLYYLGKSGYHALKRSKRALKRLFDIKREDVYWTFRIGPWRVKRFKKAYYDQTMTWMSGRLHSAECMAGSLHGELAALQDEKNRISESYDALCIKRQETLAALETAGNERKALEEELVRRGDALEELRRDGENQKAAIAALRETSESQKTAIAALQETSEMQRDKNNALQHSFDVKNEEAEKLYTTLEDYHKEFDGFHHATWNTGWVDVWKQYYIKNYEKIDDKLDRLKRAMDEESMAVIDRHCYRNFRLLPMQEDAGLFRYDHRHIYTEAEREGAAAPLDEAYFRSRYKIPADEYLETPVFKFRCGLSLLPAKALGTLAGKDIIDGGAYWGDSALIFGEYSPKRIFAFEPQPETFAKLKKTIRDNALEETVIPLQLGLGDRQEEKELYTRGMLSGANLSGVAPSQMDGEERIDRIRLTSIDQCADSYAMCVGLIKLDIEGNELNAIHGATEVIKRDKPILAISVYHRPEDLFEIKPYLESLDLGYRFMVRKLVFHDLVSEVMLLGFINEKED